MWLPYFEQIWLLNGMKMLWYSVCLLLLFLFKTNDKKGHLDENELVIFFQKWHYESYLITAMFKVPSQQLRGTLTAAFWRILYSWIQTWINIRVKSFVKTSVKIKRCKSMKVSGKRLVAQKSKCALRRTLHLNKPRFIYSVRFFWSQT